MPEEAEKTTCASVVIGLNALDLDCIAHQRESSPSQSTEGNAVSQEVANGQTAASHFRFQVPAVGVVLGTSGPWHTDRTGA